MPISLEIENKINTYMNDFETTYNVLTNIDDKISKLNQSLAIKEAEQSIEGLRKDIDNLK